MKVLIVDDNRTIRHLLRLTFADSRFSVMEADCSDAAVQMLWEHKPDCVVLDVMMPGDLDGFQICSKIKADPEMSHCSVIMLTARTQREDMQLGQSMGADYYVTKPFSPKELIKIVDSMEQNARNVGSHQD